MGPDSYAIIALGMVDDLLADKDNSRLKLFEQAAGVSKYKLRKKETLSKLQQTEEDLNRVEDLLFEIDQQVKNLEKQAKRAKRFLELKADYKTQSIEFHNLKINQYKNNYKRLENKIDEEKRALEHAEKNVEILERKVEKSKSSNLEQEQNLTLAQRNLNNLIGRIKNKENDQKMLSQKNLFIQQNNEKLEGRIENLSTRLSESDKDISKFEDSVKTEEQVLNIYASEMHEAQDKLEEIRKKHSDIKIELDAYLQQQKNLNNKVVDAEKQIAVNQSQLDNLVKQLSAIKERIEQRSLEINQVIESFNDNNVEVEKQKTLVNELKDLEKQRLEKLSIIEIELEKSTEQLQKSIRNLDAKKNEYQILKSLVENMEGFPESIKFLSKNRSWSETAPLLSDILYCQPEYRTAVENYLESMLSYYVVNNIQEAVSAIQLLDLNKKGKANFIILDKLTPKKPLSNIKEGIPALSILEIDQEYQLLAEYLLGNVVIVDQLKIYDSQDPQIVYLTKDGKYTHKGISIHGGSIGAFEGKQIGRKKNLDLLQSDIQELEKENQNIKNTFETLKNQTAALKSENKQSEINQQEQIHQRITEKGIGLKSKIDNFNAFKEESETQKINLEQQAKQIKSKIKDFEGDLENYEEQLFKLNAQLSEKDKNFKNTAEELSKASSDFNHKHIEQVRQQNKLNAVKKELEFAVRQKQDIFEQIKRDKETLQQSGSELGNVNFEIIEIENSLQELYEEKKILQAGLNEAEKSFFHAKGAILELEEEWKKSQKTHQNLFQILHQLENQFADIKLHLSTIGERLRLEFDLNINDLINREPNLELNIDELESSVEKMRRQINEFGAVNPMAIEAYDEAKVRFDFISQQRADLLASKETLLETIAEIDESATKKFMAAFNQVRENFVNVFRSLFEEDDTCDLILTDPQNPLESRIEIIAKPKGKRPLSINQLSGGEKTLTATALLFSLYLLKPAPFCIFDEVDAPLDDANIAKFNNIIKDFSANSQFIIVTHNKKTMSSVDIMYGVTMVQGISKVVPVDFRELEAID
jgi:chromosome segregation protein